MREICKKTILIVPILGMFLLIACGSTSKIKPANSTITKKEVGFAFDISKYDRVLVRNFVDAASVNIKKERKRTRKREEVKPLLIKYPDILASEIRKNGNFLEVLREGYIDEHTLVIDGQITEYKEGNSALKLLVGFGAGSSKFDADVRFKDGGTGQLLGTVKVNKNSWVLGGWLATSQKPEDLMQASSKKIGDQLYKMRPYAPAPRTQYGTGYEYQGGTNTQQETINSYNEKY